MIRGRSTARNLLAAGLLAALVLAAGACGKRGAPHAPEGQEDAFTFPRFFPGPSKQLPIFGGTPAAATSEPESEQDKERKKRRRAKVLEENQQQQRRLFGEETDFGPFSEDDETYETSPR